jgi:hypothetical protein
MFGRMPRIQATALVVHALPTVGLLGQGLLYVTATECMPYHADALGASWAELPPNYQGFLLGVLKAMGAGSVAASLALLVLLLVPFRRGQAWARWAVPLVGVVFTGLTLYASATIAMRTPASPPWRPTCGLVAMYLIGAVISWWPARGADGRGPSGRPH